MKSNAHYSHVIIWRFFTLTRCALFVMQQHEKRGRNHRAAWPGKTGQQAGRYRPGCIGLAGGRITPRAKPGAAGGQVSRQRQQQATLKRGRNHRAAWPGKTGQQAAHAPAGHVETGRNQRATLPANQRLSVPPAATAAAIICLYFSPGFPAHALRTAPTVFDTAPAADSCATPIGSPPNIIEEKT